MVIDYGVKYDEDLIMAPAYSNKRLNTHSSSRRIPYLKPNPHNVVKLFNLKSERRLNSYSNSLLGKHEPNDQGKRNNLASFP